MKRYHIGFYPRVSKRLKPASEEHKVELYRSIDTVFSMIGDSVECYLVGGLGVDLNVGSINRFHHDIDIEVSERDAKTLVDIMHAHDYHPAHKIFTTNIPTNKRMALYKDAVPEDLVPESMNRIRLIKIKNGKVSNDPMDKIPYFDISFTRQTPEGIMVGYKQELFVLPFSYEGPRVIIPGTNTTVRLRNPAHHAYLKMSYDNPIDNFDLENLKRILSEEQLNILAEKKENLCRFKFLPYIS